MTGIQSPVKSAASAIRAVFAYFDIPGAGTQKLPLSALLAKRERRLTRRRICLFEPLFIASMALN